MLNNAYLLELYREEKALIIGEEPTGLEPFPSFREWKSEYRREYNETHKTVSIKEADRLAEEAQADLERAGLSVDLRDGMSDNIPNVKKKTLNLNQLNLKRRRPMSDDTNTVTTAPSKASIARQIFAEDFGKTARKDVIARFQAEVAPEFR